MFKGNSYVPAILSMEIPGIPGSSFLVNDDFTTNGSKGSKGSKGCMIVATRTIKIFPCINSGFQC